MAALNSLLPIEFIKPGTLLGTLFYALVFFLGAWLGARALRLSVAKLLNGDEHRGIDHTVRWSA